MHSIAEFGSNVPAFLGKLWKMVEDPDTNDLITWSLTGTSFLIKDEIRFARELLPMYYKHNNMASFIRQLNMYGFHKIVSPEAGSMKMGAQEEVQFSHPCFVRGHAFMLDNIKRKIGVSKNIDTISGAGDKPPQLLSKVLSDMRQMKGRQENMEGRLKSMKLENATLWQELSVLRQKHIKQQQIVNKLIQFLVSIVHQNQNTLSVKRKVFPRMLQHHHRHRKHHLDVEDCATSSATSPGGPVIHELDPTEALLEDVVEEAESITPITETPVSDYFLNQHNEDEEQGSFDVSSEPLVLNETGETIIGIPEDTLIINVKDKPKQNHKQMVINNRSAPIIIPSVHVKSEESAKPKTLKIIKKRPTKNETNLMMQPSQIALQRPALKQTVSAQPQVNNKEIVINNQVLHGRRRNTKKTQLRKLNLNLQDKLLGFQKQNTVENQNQEINSLPINSNSLLKTDQGAVSAQQLVKSNTVPQRKQGLISVEQPQSIALTQVITVPYDSGHNEDGEQGSFDVSSEPLVLNETGETIIGIPEDTLIINVKNQPKQNHKQMVINNSSAPIIIPSVHVKSEESAKPKTLKIIKKRPTKNETNLMMQPSQITLQRPALKQTVSAQPQVNNKEIVKNNQVLHGRRRNTKKTQLRKLNLNLQDKLLGFQKQNTVENQNQEINALPINSNSLLKTDQGAVSAQQLVKSNTVPQRKQGLISVEQPQSIALTQVITVPYDSGVCETILPDTTSNTMDSIILPMDSEEFSMPLAVDSTLPDSRRIVASPDPVLTTCVTNPSPQSPQFLPPPDNTALPKTSSPSPSQDLQLARMDDSQVSHSPNLVSSNEMDNHLESVQSDLDSLKELLRSEGISLDANTLLGCFNEDPLSYNIMTNPNSEQDQLLKENNGNELMAYSPSLFDLTDLMGNDWNLPSPGAQQPAEDMFAEVNTPPFVPQSPTYPVPAKKRKK